MSGQSDNLGRVRARLEDVILAFCQESLETGRPEFRMADLKAHVEASAVAHAPASPDRILRLLRKDGLVNYEVIDRAGSLYRLLPVAEDVPPDRRRQGELFGAPAAGWNEDRR